jgi:HK97 family phage major capsid protein
LSTELLTDSFVDLIPLISSGIGEVVGRSEEKFFEVGTGSNQPTGLVTAAINVGTQVDSNVGSGALTFDGVLDLLASVDPIYENEVALFMTNQTKWSLRKVKDNNGRYLWSELYGAVDKAMPDSIEDRPVITMTSGFMSDYTGSGAGTGTGGSAPFIIAAVPSKFMIREVGGIKISVNPYLLQKTGQVEIFGEQRVDSNYVGPARSICYLATN